MGQLDTTTGGLTYVNAGHPPPLVLRGDSQVEAPDSPPRIPLGLGREPVQQVEVALQPGDRLLLHSDGVIEGRDDSGSPFGVERLVRLVIENPGAHLSELAFLLVAASLAHQGGETRDDATVLLLRLGPGR